MQCCICEKSQCVGKSKYSSNSRIKAHRNDVWRKDGPPCDNQFQMAGQNFNADAKFTIVELVNDKSLSKSKFCSLLQHREDFSILNLQTLSNSRSNHISTLLDPQTLRSSGHYWIYLVAIVRLVSTHLFDHFSLYKPYNVDGLY